MSRMVISDIAEALQADRENPMNSAELAELLAEANQLRASLETELREATAAWDAAAIRSTPERDLDKMAAGTERLSRRMDRIDAILAELRQRHEGRAAEETGTEKRARFDVALARRSSAASQIDLALASFDEAMSGFETATEELLALQLIHPATTSIFNIHAPLAAAANRTSNRIARLLAANPAIPPASFVETETRLQACLRDNIEARL